MNYYLKKTLLIAISFCFILSYVNAQKVFNIETDGAVGKLKCVAHIPKLKQNDKCPFVVIMHGFTGNKNETLLKQISEGLQSRGIGSIRFDFNAHGESEGRFEDMTIKNEVEDAMRVIGMVKGWEYVDSNRIGLVGHSQGGLVASLTAGMLGNKNVKALLLLAPAANICEDVKHGKMLGTSFNVNNIPQTINVWGHKVGREYLVFAKNCDVYGIASKFQGPVCVIHGSNDKAVPFKYGKKYVDIYKNSTWVLQNNDDHGLSKHRPQTLNAIYGFFTNSL